VSVDYTPPTWVFKCAQGHRCEGGEAVAAEALRELAALKARRCDGCAWAKPLDASSLWVRGGDDMRRCDVQTQVEAPMLSDCTPRTAKWQEIVVRADHACNAWMAKEPTT
jgi:hypothetical protein